MKKRLRQKDIYPGLLVGLKAQEYSHFLGEDISSRVGIVIKELTRKRYRVAWTNGKMEDVWIWNLRKYSQHWEEF